MDPVILIANLLLFGGAAVLILYPLWKQTRIEAIFQIDRTGQTLEEYEARYQASLAALKELMFDYEMGKVSEEDYQLLLANGKLEAAQLRQQIDRLHQSFESEFDPTLSAEIETLVSQLRTSGPNGYEPLLRDIDSEIERLKQLSSSGLACPNCGQAYESGDAFCTGCGEALPKVQPAERLCPECGHAVQVDDAFCAGCGTALAQPETPEKLSV